MVVGEDRAAENAFRRRALIRWPDVVKIKYLSIQLAHGSGLGVDHMVLSTQLPVLATLVHQAQRLSQHPVCARVCRCGCEDVHAHSKVGLDENKGRKARKHMFVVLLSSIIQSSAVGLYSLHFDALKHHNTCSWLSSLRRAAPRP